MSKPKRTLVSDALAAAEEEAVVTPSRDNVVTLSPDTPPEPMAPRRARGGVRHSYHASLYMPEEAAFALREIALMKRYKKPHTVLLEAMAELFEKYNKGDLAAELRQRMSRDDVTA